MVDLKLGQIWFDKSANTLYEVAGIPAINQSDISLKVSQLSTGGSVYWQNIDKWDFERWIQNGFLTLWDDTNTTTEVKEEYHRHVFLRYQGFRDVHDICFCGQKRIVDYMRGDK